MLRQNSDEQIKYCSLNVEQNSPIGTLTDASDPTNVLQLSIHVQWYTK